MEVVLLLFRLSLAGIFGVAGAAKFADLQGSKKAMLGFGVPGSIAGTLAVALPLAEIGIAVSLIFPRSSWYGAICAAALLILFIAGMAVQMAKGQAPDCHCFGQLHSEPVSHKSLVRNAIFALPALGLVVSGPARQGLSVLNMNTEIVQLFAILAGLAILAFGLFYLRRISEQQTQIMRRIELLDLISKDGKPVERATVGDPSEALPIGALVPDFEISDVAGGIFTREAMLDTGLPTIFFYVSTTCSPCAALAPKFVEWSAELGQRVNFVLVSSGKPDANVEKFGSDPRRTILLQNDRELADLLHLKWTPAAILVDALGKIASHVATGDAAIIELVEKIKASDLTRDYLHFAVPNGNGIAKNVPIGGLVPDFSIESIDGKTVSAADLRGRKTLITFWSPTCSHCAKMIDEIREWDLAKSQDDPSLIVFSNGDIESHRSIGLRSPIVLDKDYELAGKIGMYGTPSAFLIDEYGRYASEVAVGAENIWSLVRKR